jgi:hypothetical protein
MLSLVHFLIRMADPFAKLCDFFFLEPMNVQSEFVYYFLTVTEKCATYINHSGLLEYTMLTAHACIIAHMPFPINIHRHYVLCIYFWSLWGRSFEQHEVLHSISGCFPKSGSFIMNSLNGLHKMDTFWGRFYVYFPVLDYAQRISCAKIPNIEGFSLNFVAEMSPYFISM